MCRHLSVAENMFLGRELAGKFTLDNRKMRQEADIGGALLLNLGAEYEYMVSENVYLTGGLGYQFDVMNEDTKFDGHVVRDVTFGGGYARLGAKFLF